MIRAITEKGQLFYVERMGRGCIKIYYFVCWKEVKEGYG
jgi:hypothetical protein